MAEPTPTNMKVTFLDEDMSDWSVRILTGRFFINGERESHLIDHDERVYTVATSLLPTKELQRVIECAFDAGRALERRETSVGEK